MLTIEPVAAVPELLPEVKALYKRSFPRRERIPFSVMTKENSGTSEVFVFLNDREFVALCCLLNNIGITHIIYLAVEEKYRDHGYGSEILQLIHKQKPGRRIIVNIEMPEEDASNEDQRLMRKPERKRSLYCLHAEHRQNIIEKRWKEEGKIRNMGFSYHSSAELLDRILTEHPEVDFVQIALNAVDCRSGFVQSKACYDVIRRHGKKVVIMESVKGGELAHLPAEAEALLRKLDPDRSDASWALRYAQQLDGVIAALSGMSTLKQVKDNVKTANETGPMTAEEKEAYEKAIDLFLAQGPLTKEEIEQYKGLTYVGVPVTDILQEYNTLKCLKNPTFTDDGNYLKQVLAERAHLDLFNDKLPEDTVILSDGTDRTDFVKEAFEYCKSVSW